MKVVLVGATGTIGQAVAQALAANHEVVAVSHSHGAHRVDIASKASIEAMYAAIGQFDAVVSCAGQAAFKPLLDLADEDFQLGIGNKLMGQVNLVRVGLRHAAPGTAFVLTTGLLAREPAPACSAISMVNAGLEAFVRGAALDVPLPTRINVVSPPWVTETRIAWGMDPEPGTPAAEVAKAYLAALASTESGKVIDAKTLAWS